VRAVCWQIFVRTLLLQSVLALSCAAAARIGPNDIAAHQVSWGGPSSEACRRGVFNHAWTLGRWRCSSGCPPPS
jgi:hypothetical protein